MANRRIYYACEAVGLSPFQTVSDYTTIRGLQSVGVNTKFNLEQVFEIGQLAIYENIENVPDVDITLEKVLDGFPLIYHLATQGSAASTLVSRSNQRAHLALSIYDDTVALASGTPISQCIMSGVYVSQVGYDIMVEGNAKESVSLVGNNKVWLTSSFTYSGMMPVHDVSGLSPAAASGVNRRQDFVMASCRFPTDIHGISASGTNNETSGAFAVAFQSVKVSANLGREQMLELGRKGPYFRYVNFPVEISTTFEVIAKDGDFFNCDENNSSDVSQQVIKLKMNEGLTIDLGSKNLCNSVNYGGANAGSRGGNATQSFSYITFNDFDVRHPADPGGFTPAF